MKSFESLEKVFECLWKFLKVSEILRKSQKVSWKSLKVSESHWKSLKVTESLRKSLENIWKSFNESHGHALETCFESRCVQFCFMWWNFFGKNRERDNGTVLIGKHWSFFEWAFLVLQQQPDRPSDGLTNSWRYRTATFVKIPPFSFGWFEREMSNKSWQISGILQCQHKRAKKIIKAKRAKGGHNSLQN